MENTAVVTSETELDTVDKQHQRAVSQRLAHRAATTLAFTKSVESLVGFVGAPLTAYLANVNETRAVRQWMTGDRVPHPATQSKLQLALQVAIFLQQEGEEEVIGAWFQGLNPALDDQTPADLIHAAGSTEELSAVGRRVLAAAREFADN